MSVTMWPRFCVRDMMDGGAVLQLIKMLIMAQESFILIICFLILLLTQRGSSFLSLPNDLYIYRYKYKLSKNGTTDIPATTLLIQSFLKAISNFLKWY